MRAVVQAKAGLVLRITWNNSQKPRIGCAGFTTQYGCFASLHPPHDSSVSDADQVYWTIQHPAFSKTACACYVWRQLGPGRSHLFGKRLHFLGSSFFLTSHRSAGSFARYLLLCRPIPTMTHHVVATADPPFLSSWKIDMLHLDAYDDKWQAVASIEAC